MLVGVDHITYEVSPSDLVDGSELECFMKVLGLEEIEVEESVPDGWAVRWWEADGGLVVHCVAKGGEQHMRQIGLGHFCLVVPEHRYKMIERNYPRFIQRNSGSGRLWLACANAGVRVELRSTHREVEPGGSVDAPGEAPEISDRKAIETGERFLREFAETQPRRAPDDIVTVKFEGLEDDPQMAVLIRAFAVYKEREKKYQGHWKRYGWRGALSELRKAAERAWHLLWNLPPEEGTGAGAPFNDIDVDDLLDTINYAAFAIRAVEEGNRDGEGGWW